MKLRCLWVTLLLLVAASSPLAEDFSLFPDRKELRSPDGRFVIRSVELSHQTSEFTGAFRALVLEEIETGISRKLYSYVGRVAVAWSGNDYILVTDYVSKRTARALMFAADGRMEPLVLDKTQLERMLPATMSRHLQRNDHVYVEAVRVEAASLRLRVWGYGASDPQGFRWECRYDFASVTASCQERVGGGPQP
jgi:hypothetical protein